MGIFKNSRPFGSIVTDGLVLNLDATNINSYPGSGTTWFDISIYKNNGTLTNGPTFLQERGRGSIVLDGSNDIIQLPSFTFNASTSFTFSAWFKRNILSSMNNKYLLQQGTGIGRVWFGVIDESNNYGLLYNNTYYGAGQDYWQLVTNNFKDLNWYNLVLVQDKINLVQKSYLNAIEKASTSLSGTLNTAAGTYASTQINASVSNYQIYNRALSTQEVLQNYNALKSRFNL